MSYNPFARGVFPVGVRTVELHDDSGRRMPVELWYPVAERYRGEDLDEATRDRFTIARGFPEEAQEAVRGAEPTHDLSSLVLYFHGGYGHRRESTRLCTHLASHGYVVAAPDFPGDNIADLLPSEDGSDASVAKTPIDESAARRPGQASFCIDQVLSKIPSLGLSVDLARIGTFGMSMGGFTSLALNSVDRRPAATFAMCPMFGESSPIPQVRRLQTLLRVDDWERRVQTFVLAGEVDPFVLVEDIRELHRRLPMPKRLVILERAGHFHFVDNSEKGHEQYRQAYLSGEFPDPEIDAVALGKAMRPFAELCTEAQATDTMRALCLTHMDAHLKDCQDALSFLSGDLAMTFAARGIALEVA